MMPTAPASPEDRKRTRTDMAVTYRERTGQSASHRHLPEGSGRRSKPRSLCSGLGFLIPEQGCVLVQGADSFSGPSLSSLPVPLPSPPTDPHGQSPCPQGSQYSREANEAGQL